MLSVCLSNWFTIIFEISHSCATVRSRCRARTSKYPSCENSCTEFPHGEDDDDGEAYLKEFKTAENAPDFAKIEKAREWSRLIKNSIHKGITLDTKIMCYNANFSSVQFKIEACDGDIPCIRSNMTCTGNRNNPWKIEIPKICKKCDNNHTEV